MERPTIGDMTEAELIRFIRTKVLSDASASSSSSEVLKLAVAGGDRRVAFGTATLSFSASTNSATTTVPHGLGLTPLIVIATAISSPTFGQIPTFNAFTFDASNFKINGEITTAYTGSIDFSWLAIG